MIKGIIFDCDGTLVDSERLFNRALSLKLASRGIDLTAGQLVSRFRGEKFAKVLTSLQQEYAVILDDAFVDEYRSLVETFFKKELKACDGVVNTLSQIKLPMAVASNGPLVKMQIAITVTGLGDYFDKHLYSAYEVDSWKPDPALFLYVANQLKLQANECLVVEDSEVGIDGAIAANMKAVLYDPNGVHERYYDDLSDQGKANVKKIAHFSALLGVLN